MEGGGEFPKRIREFIYYSNGVNADGIAALLIPLATYSLDHLSLKSAVARNCKIFIFLSLFLFIYLFIELLIYSPGASPSIPATSLSVTGLPEYKIKITRF